MNGVILLLVFINFYNAFHFVTFMLIFKLYVFLCIFMYFRPWENGYYGISIFVLYFAFGKMENKSRRVTWGFSISHFVARDFMTRGGMW